MKRNLTQLTDQMRGLVQQGDMFYAKMKKYVDLRTVLNYETPTEEKKENEDGLQLLDRQDRV